MEQQFSLSWREFQDNLTSGCAHLLSSGEFADVTLATEGRLLKAHKLVLSICSPFFQKMFHANPCQHPIVVLKDISFNAMKDLLQFMYFGEVSVKQEDLTNLISTAETLEIKGLTNKINNQENNNDISPNSPIKSCNPFFNSVEKSRSSEDVDDCIRPVNQHDIQQMELLNQLSKLASLKRRCDSLLSKNYESDINAIMPEKRTKLREKHILNRHKISNSFNKNVLQETCTNGKYKDNIVTTESNQYFVKDNVSNYYENTNASNQQNSIHDTSSESNIEVPEDSVKKEIEDIDINGSNVNAKRSESINDVESQNQTLSTHQIEQDGVIVNPTSPSLSLAPWPGSVQPVKGFLPFSEHKIITIPQKEDGKKKYPQKSCRYCWRAGRRRDTRFMCEQCCVPLCKLVCFERHQASLEPLLFKDDPTISILNK